MSRSNEFILRESQRDSASVQLAVSQFISKTYGWMFVGLLVTGFVSAWVVSSPSVLQQVLENRSVFYGVLIAEVLLVMGMSALFSRLSSFAAMLGFLTYSALNGVTFSLIFLIYTMSSISQVFLIAAGMFGGLALFGSVTRKDLTGMGAFVGMGIWGMILVGLVNLWVQSEALSFGVSAAGVLIFSGLTAYDAQRIRSLAYQYAHGGANGGGDLLDGRKGAIFGALSVLANYDFS